MAEEALTYDELVQALQAQQQQVQDALDAAAAADQRRFDEVRDAVRERDQAEADRRDALAVARGIQEAQQDARRMGLRAQAQPPYKVEHHGSEEPKTSTEQTSTGPGVD